MRIRFKHLVEDRDRHGNIRLYVRIPGRPKVRIRASFGTDEFIAAYNAAISDHVAAPRQANEAKPGSFRYLCIRYYSKGDRFRVGCDQWAATTSGNVCIGRMEGKAWAST